MARYNYSFDQFFNAYKDAKNKLEIFIFNDWKRLSFNQFRKLPNNTPFIALGHEWTKKDGFVS